MVCCFNQSPQQFWQISASTRCPIAPGNGGRSKPARVVLQREQVKSDTANSAERSIRRHMGAERVRKDASFKRQCVSPPPPTPPLLTPTSLIAHRSGSNRPRRSRDESCRCNRLRAAARTPAGARWRSPRATSSGCRDFVQCHVFLARCWVW